MCSLAGGSGTRKLRQKLDLGLFLVVRCEAFEAAEIEPFGLPVQSLAWELRASVTVVGGSEELE